MCAESEGTQLLLGLGIGVAVGACLVVFFFLLWETRRVLGTLNVAVVQFAATTQAGPELMAEAVHALKEIQAAVDIQASRRTYRRPGRMTDQPAPEDPIAREWKNPMDEVAREGAEVGTGP